MGQGDSEPTGTFAGHLPNESIPKAGSSTALTKVSAYSRLSASVEFTGSILIGPVTLTSRQGEIRGQIAGATTSQAQEGRVNGSH
jgi:hypothetical protein